MNAFPEDAATDVGAGIAEDRRARILRRMAWPAAALAAAGLIAWFYPRPEAGDDGRDVPEWLGIGFTLHGEVDVLDYESGTLLMTGRGYHALPDPYGPDFTLAYAYRFPDAADLPEDERPTCNTGCLLFITGEDRVWPRCLEVQGKWSETASIKSNARDVQVTATLDEPARDAARRPPGEWNRVEVVSTGGALRVSLNGVEVATSEPTELTRGRIGFQAEGFPVEFRGVTIEER